MITSRQNERVRLLKKLLSDGQERRKHGLFVIEGEKILREYTARGHTPVAVYVSGADISPDIAKYISDTVTPAGVFALCELTPGMFEVPLESRCQPGFGHLLILDGVSDPGNVGTLIRSAEAFGWDGVICSPDCADSMGGKAFRAAMGSRLRVPVQTCEIAPYIRELRTGGFEVYAAVLDDTALPLCEAGSQLNGGGDSAIAVVIGSEACGVSEAVRGECTHGVYIPIQGAESLNAAVAGSIILYHLNRAGQRKNKPGG
ncbi:23S rRNA methyltransferase [Clostridia bacterium]|nr:23S rRNA methyltransferase [Clostridia bacterium]